MNNRFPFCSGSLVRTLATLLLAAVLCALPSRARAQLYVGVAESDSVVEFDPATGNTISGDLVGLLVGSPTGLTLSGNNILVTNSYATTVGEYNATTGQVIKAAFVNGPLNPRGVLVSGNTLYVSSSDSVLTYNATTGQVLNSNFITAGLNTPQGLAISGNTLFVANAEGNSIGTFNATTGAAINTSFITGLNNPVGLALSGNVLYVANFFGSTVGAYDATTGKAIDANFVTGLGMPWGLAISGDSLFVSDEDTSFVDEYDISTGVAINEHVFNTGLPPQGLAIASVPDPSDATLSNLVPSVGTLSPVFISGATDYAVAVPASTTSLTLTPTVNQANATVTVNGVPVVSGSASVPINVPLGPSTETVVVTAPDGVTTQTYTVTITQLTTPIATTQAPTGMLATSVTLNGTVNANGASTIVSFLYGTTTSYGSKVAATPSPVTGTTPTAVSAKLTGLKPLTTYHYELQGVSTIGTGTSGDMMFTTPNNVATLSGLELSSGTLTPVFKNTTLSYTATVTATTVTLTPTVTDTNATVTVNGATVLTGNASNTINLNPGINAIPVVVTAQGGVTTKTYTVTITQLTPPLVTTLAETGLGSTSVTLNGMVDANAEGTTVNFVYGTTTNYGSTVAATPATVTGSIATAVSAKLTGLKPLTTYHYQAKGVSTAGMGAGGDMQFTTPNNVTTLSGLVLSSGPLTPVFKNTTLSYTATVSNPTPSVMLTPTTTDPNATVTVNGATTLSGSASAPIILNAGSNTISVVVTAQDGVTKKTYTVKVTRTALLATMSTLAATNIGTTTATLNGTAVANNGNTTLRFDYGTSTAYGKTITATPSSANGTASTSISATPAGLASGTTYHFRAQGVNIAGMANGADMTFTTVSNAATLSGLKLSAGTLTPAFSSGTLVYAATVANTKTSLTVTPTAANSHATITVNGSVVTTGTTSAAVTLAPGPNVITLVVTAQDGVTVKTYTVNVTRTTPAPVVVTQAATSVGSTGAIFNGTVNASNTSTTPSFQYGLTTSYGSSITAASSPLTGSTVTPVTAIVSGLLPAKTYHYRVSAINVGGTSNGLDATFTTPNNVATLSKLVLSTGAMDQTFSPTTTSYTQTVSSTTTSLTVTPTITSGSNATVTVNSNAVASGKASTVAVTTGSNTINVVVTAQNGTTTNTYSITVTVPAAAGVVQQANTQAVPALPSGALVPIKAQLTGPVANGGVLPGATVTFTWNAGRSVSAYRLSIGTTEGATDLYDGVEGLALTHTVTLPTTGADLYVTLRSMINGAWLANNYLFSAADTTVKAVLLTPADQSVLTAATQTFTWGAVPGAQAYWLSIGSTDGGADLYNASQGTALTQNVTLPTDGRELFVALQTSLNGQWVASNSTLTAAGTGAPVTAQLTSPADQSVLLGSPVTFTWEAGAGVSEYWLSLGSSPSATDLYTAGQGTNQSVTIAVPADGSPLYLTLSSLINGQWHFEQYLLQAALPQ